MLNKIFNFIEQNKFKSKFFMSLLNNKTLVWTWNIFKYYIYAWPKQPELTQKNADFFRQNEKRISTITNLLSDKKSKKVYLQVIKFLQTFKKTDFPLLNHSKVQYFIKEIKPKLSENEVFIDCGAFDGDTIREFLQYCPKYKQIISLEPDTANFKQLQAKHNSTPNTTLINAGVWNDDGTVSFASNYHSGMIIAGGGDELTTIQVKSIDKLNLDKVTFIKMDIEGAELEALKGAQKTILRDKPKLAICLYHSNEDLLNVPEFINKLVPEYKLYIRQHMSVPNACTETVLYAII